jgi:HSP20 family molecular chaperone IbpA
MMSDLSRLFDRMGHRFDQMFDDLDTMLDEVSSVRVSSNMSTTYEVVKRANGVTIKVGVPGCTDKDVQVTLNDGIIAVVAQTLGIARGFRVGYKVKVTDITATVTNGLLTIEVKRQEQPAGPSGAVKVTQG